MSFVREHDSLPWAALHRRALVASADEAARSLGQDRLSLEDFAALLAPAAAAHLEAIAQKSQTLTRRRFGKVIRFFAPLYLSNECVNACQYCGFSRHNTIHRVTLAPEDVQREARAIRDQGFRNLLLVAGEHPKLVSVPYLTDCVSTLHQEFPSLALEIGPLSEEGYRPLVQAGADGLVIYQETYHREVYAEMHPSGPKRDFAWRLETPERAYAAGFKRIGLGALYGLHDWRHEALAVAAHAAYLLRHCWKAFLTISLPRLRPAAGHFTPRDVMTDREMVQLVCAYRLMFPDVGLVLSTRENARLRDGLIPLGITLISAGSHTEPGGYTGAGQDHSQATPGAQACGIATGATGQFQIADERSAHDVAALIRRLGYEPVWKDWDAALA